MKEPIIVRLEDTEPVSFGPLSQYRLIIGDDEGTTPVRTGIQTAQPGYVAPVHLRTSVTRSLRSATSFTLITWSAPNALASSSRPGSWSTTITVEAPMSFATAAA